MILSISTLSKTVIFTTWAIAATVLSFFPLSVIFFDGQSIPDILAGIGVLPKRNSFGVFNLELSEDYVFCFAGTDKAPEGPILAGTYRNLSPSASLNELAWLFLGKHLGTYADVVEHIPVYSWQ